MPFGNCQQLNAVRMLRIEKYPTHNLGESWHGSGIGGTDYAHKWRLAMRYERQLPWRVMTPVTYSHEDFDKALFPDFGGEDKEAG